jgi:hypothetical protein
MNIHEKIFYIGVIMSYLLYGIVFAGLYSKAPRYLYLLKMAIKIYVSLFLIIRFNPYVKTTFTEFDRKIAYTSGIFLILTTTLTDLIINYIQRVDKQLGLYLGDYNLNG